MKMTTCWCLLVLSSFASDASAPRYSPSSIDIFHAARKGKLRKVLVYIKRGGKINKKDKVGKTPLYWAVANNHEKIVTALIKAGADVNASTYGEYTWYHWFARCIYYSTLDVTLEPYWLNISGKTPLYTAAEQGYEAIANALMEAGADVDKPDCKGWTPLHNAIIEKHEGIVLALVRAGADVNKANKFGDTPMSLIARFGTDKMAQALLGVTHLNANTTDKDGCTPLDCAITYKNISTANLIKNHIAKTSAYGQILPLLAAASNPRIRVKSPARFLPLNDYFFRRLLILLRQNCYSELGRLKHKKCYVGPTIMHKYSSPWN